jgi:hypothetical protein
MRRSTSLAAVFSLVLMISSAVDATACQRCLKSPDGKFQFCRSGYMRGDMDCSYSDPDPFTGRTNCGADYMLWDCYNGGTRITDGTPGGPGIDDDDPVVNYGRNSPCSWTDVEVIRVV